MKEGDRPTGKQVKEAVDRLVGPQKQEVDRRCSFCGKVEQEVAQLIAGPSVFICDECVAKCARTLRELGIDLELE